MTKVRTGEEQLVAVDARHRIPLDKDAQGLYRLNKTSFGYTLEQVEVVAKRDRELQQNTAYWNKVSQELTTDDFQSMDL